MKTNLTLIPKSLLIDDLPVIVVLLVIVAVIERLKKELDPVLFIELENNLDPYGDDWSGLESELELNAFYIEPIIQKYAKYVVRP